MKCELKRTLVLLMSLFVCFSCSNDKDNIKVDICVYGGTASGVVAAYTAKKMGKSVILVEPGKYLGGMTTGGLGHSDTEDRDDAITGFARLFYERIGAHYGKKFETNFPPSVATTEILRFVNDGDLDVLYQRRIIKSSVKDKKIRSIVVEDSSNPDKSTNKIIEAKEFIDCSYEGDLMAYSGVSYAIGREDNKEFNETINGVQMSIYHQFPDSIDPYKIEGDPNSGFCWGISNNTLEEAGTGDNLIQAYNFRLCLTNDKTNSLPFTKPENYDSSKYELLLRAMKRMKPDINQYIIINWGIMPDNKYDINNKGPLSTDMIGMNYDYPDGDYATRARIWKEHEDYTKGLLYFLSTDERVPEQVRNGINEFGWAKDEFVDNDHFPTQLYIREARRLKGEYVMTENNCMGKEDVDDGIGLGVYGMDSHNCQRIVTNGMVKNEGDVEVHGFAPYHISYRSIIPKREECTNLFVPVCVSSTHISYGSIRMEPVFMILGQSAAVAACLAINSDCDSQDVNVPQLQLILKEDPYLENSY